MRRFWHKADIATRAMLARRVRTLVGALVVIVLLIGVGSYAFVRHMADSKAGNYDRAIADYNEAIRLDPKSTLAFIGRGDVLPWLTRAA